MVCAFPVKQVGYQGPCVWEIEKVQDCQKAMEKQISE